MTISVQQINIHDRNYTTWETECLEGEQDHSFCVDPIGHKLFHGDVIKISDGKLDITKSSVRTLNYICGVLVLGQNKTYGKYKNKLLYKCIPGKSNLPMFLIPYEQKNSFSKNFKNKYVIFSFNEWNGKHPIGKLLNVFGDVSDMEAFYTYQLYYREINISFKTFIANTKYLEKYKKYDVSDLLKQYPTIVNMEKENVFSIDPEGCLDFDDAFSIHKNKKASYILRIYIANVSVWLDYLDLWKSFSDRVSTIYFPEKNHPMLPTVLSNKLCSLQKNEKRIAFVCEVHIEKLKIVDIKYFNACISIHNNYIYDEERLITNTDYLRLYNLTKNLNEEKETNYLPVVNDSHDVVAYVMILMNHLCAKDISMHKNGIYRSLTMKDNELGKVPEKIRTFVYLLKNSSGSQYVTFNEKIGHAILKLSKYIQITSPIRRLTDLLNMIQFQNNHSLIEWKNGEETKRFYEGWLERLDYINEKMKQIKKAQNDCNSLYLCTTNSDIMDTFHDGYILEKEEQQDVFHYMIYLNDLQMMVKMKNILDLPIYSNHKFKIFVFCDENSLKQKVKVQMFD